MSVEAAREWLRNMWLDMRDGAGPEAQARARGSIETAHYLGALDAEQAELWLRRVKFSCPGHDDEGGRDWCAYCGEMNRASSGTAPPGRTTQADAAEDAKESAHNFAECGREDCDLCADCGSASLPDEPPCHHSRITKGCASCWRAYAAALSTPADRLP